MGMGLFEDKMKRLLLLLPLLLACSFSRGALIAPVPTAELITQTPTTIPTPTPSGEVVGQVAVDTLTVRDAPSDEGAVLAYKKYNDFVMGHCVYIAGGDVWLHMAGGRFVAVRFEGRTLVAGVC